MNAQQNFAIQTQDGFLRRALQANALFTLVSGLVLLAGAAPLGALLGIQPPVLLAAVGAGLVLYAPFLLWVSRRDPANQPLVWLVIVLDLVWVLGSALVLVAGDLGLTVLGKWLIAITADIVALFAVLQYIGLRRI